MKTMYQILFTLSFTFLFLIGGGACLTQSSLGTAEETNEGQAGKADLDKDVQMQEVVESQKKLAYDAFRQQFQVGCEQNHIFSPLSFYSGLSMSYAGAKGETEQQMAKIGHLGVQERQHWGMKELLDVLADSANSAKGTGPKILNMMWVQQGLGIEEQFSSTLSDNYGSQVQERDFFGSPEASLLGINRYVQEQTAGKIGDLLQAGSINNQTKVVLANIINYRSVWAAPFDPKATRSGAFTTLAGTSKTMDFMSGAITAWYRITESFTAVELAFADANYSLLVILPVDFKASAHLLTVEKLAEITESMEQGKIDVLLPRFKVEAATDVKGMLQNLGLTLPFGTSADFSGIASFPGDLHITTFSHKATLSIDEKGADASAASAVVLNTRSMSQGSVHFTRPFLFILKNQELNLPIFMGWFSGMDPVQGK